MACVTVTILEAAIVTVAEKITKRHEKKAAVAEGVKLEAHKEKGMPFSKKLSVLRNMLWGGSTLLLFEHIWHGEIVPFFPFFTAAESPESFAEMLHEMATTGVVMSVAVTALWGIGMLMLKASEKSSEKLDTAEEA